jgi:hypothetical protein
MSIARHGIFCTCISPSTIYHPRIQSLFCQPQFVTGHHRSLRESVFESSDHNLVGKMTQQGRTQFCTHAVVAMIVSYEKNTRHPSSSYRVVDITPRERMSFVS